MPGRYKQKWIARSSRALQTKVDCPVKPGNDERGGVTRLEGNDEEGNDEEGNDAGRVGKARLESMAKKAITQIGKGVVKNEAGREKPVYFLTS